MNNSLSQERKQYIKHNRKRKNTGIDNTGSNINWIFSYMGNISQYECN